MRHRLAAGMLLLALMWGGCVPEKVAVSIVPGSYAVQVGKTITLETAVTGTPGAQWTYAWTAQRGAVKGSGSMATYSPSADLKPGYDEIGVVVSDETGQVAFNVCHVYIFRQFVVLKADDLPSYKAITDNWKYYFTQVVDKRHIKTAAGMITHFLDPAWNNSPTYAQDVDYIVSRNEGGCVEFYNHGYDHMMSGENYEFGGTTPAYQAEHFQKGEDLARAVLGFPLTCFGASFNATDANTVQLVDGSSDIEVCLFLKQDISKPNLERGGGEIEATTGHPSFAAFQKVYAPDQSLVVLQFHPGQVTFRESFSEFEGILDYLEARRVTFILPTEYARMQRGVLPVVNPEADSDGDGLPDGIEGEEDIDQDGMPNFLDTDSNDDGDADTLNSKGMPDYTTKPASVADPKMLRVMADATAVRAGEEVALYVAPGDQLSPVWDYTWTSTAGVIKGNGWSAVFTAPDTVEPGYTTVTVAISFKNQVLAQESFVLFLYNQFVILKADDFERMYWKLGGVSDNWGAFIDYVNGKRIKASIGMVAEALNVDFPDPATYRGDNQFAPYVSYVRKVHDIGYIEFWNHGYDHSSGGDWAEFWTTPFDLQQQHFTTSQTLAREVLGFPFTAFGAPNNKFDDSTMSILEANADIKVWLYGPGTGSSKMVLPISSVALEVERVGLPDFAGFLSRYTPDPPYVVVQIHPNSDLFQANFDQFEAMVDYLIDQKVGFINPTEYYLLMEQGVLPMDLQADSDGDGVADGDEGWGDQNSNGVPDFLDPATAS